MARPEAKIDLMELEKLCGMQCTDEEIAAFFNVSTRTIERRRKVKRFSEIMGHAKAKGRVSVRRSLFRMAAKDNVAAAIFLSKNLLGYQLPGFRATPPTPRFHQLCLLVHPSTASRTATLGQMGCSNAY